MNLVERTKKEFQDRNEIWRLLENDQKGIPYQVALDLKALIGTLQSDPHCRIDGIEFKWDRMSQRSRSNEMRRKKCVFSSHDPISVNIEAKCSKREPKERSLCLASRSLSSGSILSLFIAFHSLGLCDPHDFILRFDFCLIFFIHAWDPGATHGK